MPSSAATAAGARPGPRARPCPPGRRARAVERERRPPAQHHVDLLVPHAVSVPVRLDHILARPLGRIRAHADDPRADRARSGRQVVSAPGHGIASSSSIRTACHPLTAAASRGGCGPAVSAPRSAMTSSSRRRAPSTRRGPSRSASSAEIAARCTRAASIAPSPRAVSATRRARASSGSRPALDVAAPLEVGDRLGDRLLRDGEPVGERADRHRFLDEVLEHEPVGEPHVGEPVGGEPALQLVGQRPAGEQRGE